MADGPRTGPPPEKRERRPAGTTAAHLKDGSRNRDDLTTTPAAIEALSSMNAGMAPILDLEDWGERAGIPVVPISPPLHLESLIARQAPAWIAGDCCCADEEEIAFAVEHATQIIIADNVGRFDHVAADLALAGERVLLLDWPEGTPLRLPNGNPGEGGAK